MILIWLLKIPIPYKLKDELSCCNLLKNYITFQKEKYFEEKDQF